MPATPEDYAKVKAQQADLQQQAGAYQATATSLGANVMEAVRADRAQRGVSQLATDVGNTMGQLPTDQAGIIQRAGNLVAPSDINSLTASQRGQNLRTLGTAATQAEYNSGTLKDILAEHANKLTAIAQQKAQEAQIAQTKADSIMQQLSYDLELRKQAEIERANRAQEAISNKTAGGGGNYLTTTETPITEPQPNPNMSVLEGTVSPGGQWFYTNGTWQPLAGKTNGTSGLSIEQLGAAMDKAAKAGDTKAVTMYKGMIATKIATDKANQPTKSSALAQRDANNAASGLAQITNIRAWVKQDPGLLGKIQIPILNQTGTMGKMVKALNEVQDVYTRLRTGAALNKDEIAFYESQIAPNLANIYDPTSFNFGLDMAETFFSGIADNNTKSNNQSLGDILGE